MDTKIKTNTKKLFQGITIGSINLAHRIVMAPLTRMRADSEGDLPNALMAQYYGQRASDGGLIISEATTISSLSRGYLGAPGIYNDEQVKGWKKIVDIIHIKGGRIFVQLWHVGRVAHTDLIGGRVPVGPSALPFDGLSYTQNGWVPVTPNRALTIPEIKEIVEQYRQAAERAKAAGFDGVEIHSGNGYLLDQFIQDGSNKREDIYGGSVENRTRLLFEVIEAVAKVWDTQQIGVRISPDTQFNSMHDSNPKATFGYIATKLNDYNIGYLHVIEPRIKGNQEIEDGLAPVASESLRKLFHGNLMSAGGFDPESAEEMVASGNANLIAFGRHFISNPDLPARIKLDLPLSKYDRDTFYGGDQHGYVDYPSVATQTVNGIS